MTPSPTLTSLKVATALALTVLGVGGMQPVHAQQFTVTNLVSDGTVPAVTIDPNLVNPWGLAASPTGPFWVSDNGTGLSTLYNTSGAKLGLEVTIPPAGSAAPTGIVFNGTSGAFVVTDPGTGKSGTAAFIFSSEDGIISGWSPAANPTMALIGADASSRPVPAIYKGLAIATPAQTGDGSYLYATNFANGLVEQFDSNYNLIRSFTDANVAAGYAPFGAQTIDGHLFVTYALRSGEDDVAGPGNGYVDMFNFDGTFVRTLVGQGGQINSPWGLDIAPASFGQYAGDLLVGNFGDGTISIFDPDTGDFIGKLLGTDGNPLVIDGLWGLMNGNGGAGGLPGSLYFTAGIDDEAHGLFGAITPAAPEPGTWAMMLLGFGAVGIAIRRSRHSASLPQLA